MLGKIGNLNDANLAVIASRIERGSADAGSQVAFINTEDEAPGNPEMPGQASTTAASPSAPSHPSSNIAPQCSLCAGDMPRANGRVMKPFSKKLTGRILMLVCLSPA